MMQAFVNLEQLQHNSLPIVFNIFNRKTRASFWALHNFLKLKDGTTILIELIIQWFKIMNKKDKNAFIQLIESLFLPYIVNWIRELQMEEGKGRNKKLTKFTAIDFVFLIGIHSRKSWTATTRHGVTKKRSTKRLQQKENLFRKNLLLKDVC